MRRTVIAFLAVALLLALPVSALAGQGSGNPRLEVSKSTLPGDQATEITVTGTDYLVPPHAPGTDVFGGVYVFFGWVSSPSSFGPSTRNSSNNNGVFGVTYLYPGEGGDANIRDDGSGIIRLVSFTPGGESGAATSYHMDDNGNWTTRLRINGSSFTSYDPRIKQTITTDCTKVQCGVFTIGAHGKASATNEKFVRINFSSPATTTTSTAPTTTSTSAPTTTSTSRAPAATAGTTQGASSDTTPTSLATEDSTPVDDVTTSTTVAGSGTPTTLQVQTETQSSSPVPVADGDAVVLGVTSTRSTTSPVALFLGAAAGAAAGIAFYLRHRHNHNRVSDKEA